MYCIADESKLLLGIIGFIIAIALLLTSMNVESVNVVNPVEYRVDSATETLMTIDYEHHEIHAGSHYYKSMVSTVSDTKNVLLRNNQSGKEIHLTFVISADSEVDIRIYENVTVTNNGTELPTYNNHRNFNDTALLELRDGTVTFTGGTQIFHTFIGSGNQETGQLTREREIVLRDDTDYIIQIEAIAVNPRVNCLLEWYEHTRRGT